MQNRALGLALKLRGVLNSSISGKKMDSDVLTWLVCSSLGLPDLGLHERVCIYMHKYTCERFASTFMQTQESKGSDVILSIAFFV